MQLFVPKLSEVPSHMPSSPGSLIYGYQWEMKEADSLWVMHQLLEVGNMLTQTLGKLSTMFSRQDSMCFSESWPLAKTKVGRTSRAQSFDLRSKRYGLMETK